MTTLRKALWANVVFTASSGLVALIGAGPLGEWMGVEPWIMVVAGIGLLGWAGLVAVFARRDPTRIKEAWLVIAGDETWVLGVLALLLGFPDLLTDNGKVTIATLTIAVATLASVQLVGLRKLRLEQDKA